MKFKIVLFGVFFSNKLLLRFNTPETALISLLCADYWRADLIVKESSQRPLHIMNSTLDYSEFQNTVHLWVFQAEHKGATDTNATYSCSCSSLRLLGCRIMISPDNFAVPSIRLHWVLTKQSSEPVSLFTMETQRYFNSAAATGSHYCTFYQVSSVSEIFV